MIDAYHAQRLPVGQKHRHRVVVEQQPRGPRAFDELGDIGPDADPAAAGKQPILHADPPSIGQLMVDGTGGVREPRETLGHPFVLGGHLLKYGLAGVHFSVAEHLHPVVTNGGPLCVSVHPPEILDLNKSVFSPVSEPAFFVGGRMRYVRGENHNAGHGPNWIKQLGRHGHDRLQSVFL